MSETTKLFAVLLAQFLGMGKVGKTFYFASLPREKAILSV
jgi:hypothetical protein